MTRVLLAGSEGYLGQSLIDQFSKHPEYEVFGVDIGPRGRLAGSYKFLGVDLTDQYSVDNIFEQAEPDIIINAAASIYGVAGFHANPAKILSNDLHLHINLLNASREFNLPKYIYTSSSMVYETEDTLLFEEMSLKLPKTDYGLSKVTGERLVEAFHRQYDLNYTIYRPFNIINPFEIADEEEEQGTSHVFADFLNNIVTRKLYPLPIIGDGSQMRTFTWHEDVAKAIVDNLQNPVTDNEVFNLGGHDPIDMKSFAHLIVHIAKKNGWLDETFVLDFKTVKEYTDDVRFRVPSIQKAGTLLNWSSETSLDFMIEKCLDNLINNVSNTKGLIAL